MNPIRLAPNNFHRFYRGGTGIAEFRGIPFVDPYTPEDWIGSTVSLFGCDGPGLSRLADGALLRDAIHDDPKDFLGPAHLQAFGPEPGVLVKLLDPDQRLPVHCHPDRAFSARHLGLRYGKSEAWLVVSARTTQPTVYLGFREALEQEQLARWVEDQDSRRLLGALNSLAVQPGDTVFVPAGLPHSVGPGIFIVELQEPTDLSVLMEWREMGIDGAREGHLGLGFGRALDCVDRSAWPKDRLQSLINQGSDDSLFPGAADRFFRAQRIQVPALLEPQFSILVVLAGAGVLRPSAGLAIPLARGDTILLGHGCGECRLEGTVTAVRCMPPRPA